MTRPTRRDVMTGRMLGSEPLSEAERLDRSIPEAELQKRVLAAARRHGWRAHHVSNSRRGRVVGTGFPDLVLVRGSTIAFLELKDQLGTLEAGQVEWLGALGATGAVARVWRPSDLTSGIIETFLREGPVG